MRSPVPFRVVMLSLVAGTLAAGPSVLAVLPPATITAHYRNGLVVPGQGNLNSPFNTTQSGVVGGVPFGPIAIDGQGNAYVVANIFAQVPLNVAILKTSSGLTPYIAGGLVGTGNSLGIPTADHALNAGFGLAANTGGTVGISLLADDADFGNPVSPVRGITFGNLAYIATEGGAVTAPGVAPGSTFVSLTSPTVLDVNDSNVFLVGATVSESGVTRRMLLKIQTNSSGGVLGQTLVAKEGGLVGAGPATWTSVSIGVGSAAINNSGQVVFSGVTSAGVEGVYRDSALIAQRNTLSPGGANWGTLLGAPVDINNSGQVAIRAPYGTGIWTEVGDAGESTAGAQLTTQGTLNIISGTLSDGYDVDMYRIRIDDFANFSATTVPGPGFPGAAGDTVLYLIRDFVNLNGITRVVLGRSDDAAAGVVQSTLTSAIMPTDANRTTGGYYLAIATPRSNPVNSAGREFFQEDPASIAVAGGKVYWSDQSEGTIVRADLGTGLIDATYPASVIAAPFPGQIAGTGESLTPPIAVATSGAQTFAYFQTDAWADSRIWRADVSAGTFVKQELVSTPTAPASPFGVTGLCVDAVAGRVFWSRGDTFDTDANGVLNYANLDGSGRTKLLDAGATVKPRHLAAAPGAQRVYFAESSSNNIQYVNVDMNPPVVTTIASGAIAGGLCVDEAGGKVYWSIPATGIIERSNLDGSGREVFKSGLTATGLRSYAGGLAVDGGFVYAADVVNRRVLRLSTSSTEPGATVAVNLPGRIGDRISDTTARLDALSSWVRTGTAGAALPYQIKLTGASAFNQQAVVVKGNTKIAAVGEVLPGTGGLPLSTVGGNDNSIRISDNGLVLWRGQWVSGSTTIAGLFLGRDKVADDNTPVTGVGTVFRAVQNGPYALDMSDNGRYIVASTIRTGSVNSVLAQYLINVVAFDSVPVGCVADFNGSGTVTVQDIFDFLSAWFSNDPSADVNGQSGVTVQDIFEFLAAWFTGC